MSYADYTDYADNTLPDLTVNSGQTQVGDNSGAPTGSDISALTANAATITGTTNYTTDTGSTGSTGSVLNSSANPVTANSGPVDASGGNGSFPNLLQNIQTQGLSDDVVSAGEFALGSLTDLMRVGAQGTTSAAGAPSAPTTQQNTGIPTWLWIVGIGAVLFLLVRE